MKNELQRHKKSDKVKWTVTAIAFVLLAVLLAGVCLQVFGKGKIQPSEWFKKTDKPQTEQEKPETKSELYTTEIYHATASARSAALNEQQIYDLTGLNCDSILSGDLLATTCSKLHVSNNVDSSTI